MAAIPISNTPEQLLSQPSFSPPYIKDFAESTAALNNFTSIPSHYVSNISNSLHDQSEQVTVTDEIPIIDFSLLANGTPDQRLQAVRDLGRACAEWGFFMVVNHGVPERLRERTMDACRGFFELEESEKLKFGGHLMLDPIRCGTSFNTSVEKVFYWRDFLKVITAGIPSIHLPEKPALFREVCQDYCTRVRVVAKELLRAISESLGLEACCLEKTSEFESGLQILAANYYPRCPQPELAMGMPPHSDHGLLTVLMQNDIGGLHIKHNGHWVLVNPLPNSFLINTGDHLEILSNGKYKSVLHRAAVNDCSARMSIAIANGPCLDKEIAPMTELMNVDDPQRYRGMTYREYFEIQQSSRLDGKSCLDLVRLPDLKV